MQPPGRFVVRNLDTGQYLKSYPDSSAPCENLKWVAHKRQAAQFPILIASQIVKLLQECGVACAVESA